MTDNGPQYSANYNEFKTFAEPYKFSHTTNSSYYPKGNGEAQRAVRILKNLLKDVKGPYLALLPYRVLSVVFLQFSY